MFAFFLIPIKSYLGNQEKFDHLWNDIKNSYYDDNFKFENIPRGYHKKISVSSSPITWITMGFQSHVEIHASKFSCVFLQANIQVAISLKGPVFCYIYNGTAIQLDIYIRNNIVPSFWSHNIGNNFQLTYINDGRNDKKITTLGNIFPPHVPPDMQTKYEGISSLNVIPYNGLICGYEAALPDFTEIGFKSSPNYYIELTFEREFFSYVFDIIIQIFLFCLKWLLIIGVLIFIIAFLLAGCKN